MRHQLRSVLLVLLGLLVAVTGGLATVPAANAVTTGTISGTVTATGGAPLDEVHVVLFAQHEQWGWSSIDDTFTDATGAYQLTDVPAGDYKVLFEASTNHLDEYWDDASSLADATVIVLSPGETESGTDAVLSPGGRISGTVTAPGGGGLITYVNAYRWSPGQEFPELVASLITKPDGKYDLTGLPTGAYRVWFGEWSHSSYVSEYWDDSATIEGSTPVAVTAGGPAVTGRNAELAPTRRTGRITGSVSGVIPDDGVWVTAYQSSGGTWHEVSHDVVAADGTYELLGLDPGTYRVGFENRSEVALEFWDDAPTLELATDIPVTSGGTTAGKNADLSVPPAPTTSTPPVVLTPPAVLTPAQQLARILDAVRVGGKAKVGRTLRIKNLAAIPGTVTYKVRWYAGKKVIKKATRPKLRLSEALGGKVVSVKVKATSAGVTRTRTIRVGKVRG